MSVEIGRQNITILFWKQRGCTASFLGIHKWEPVIYIGFSPALHLQCNGKNVIAYGTISTFKLFIIDFMLYSFVVQLRTPSSTSNGCWRSRRRGWPLAPSSWPFTSTRPGPRLAGSKTATQWRYTVQVFLFSICVPMTIVICCTKELIVKWDTI